MRTEKGPSHEKISRSSFILTEKSKWKGNKHAANLNASKCISWLTAPQRFTWITRAQPTNSILRSWSTCCTQNRKVTSMVVFLLPVTLLIGNADFISFSHFRILSKRVSVRHHSSTEESKVAIRALYHSRSKKRSGKTLRSFPYDARRIEKSHVAQLQRLKMDATRHRHAELGA
jgi:hypothetical protein